MRIHYRLFLFLLLFVCQSAFSQTTDQNYPVTAQAFVVGQPQDKLSAYFSSSTALTVNLLLKDLTRSTLQVYLQWSLEGPGVRIASAPGYIPPAFITLDRGLIHRLSGLDLQGTYFRPQAMEAEGLAAASPTQLRLPEGFYTFRVQALEAGTGREVSNLGETYFSVTTPLPPVINLPFNGAQLPVSTPQRVSIQWMPRHYRLPGHVTTYDLKVCPLPDGVATPGMEPTEALNACVNPVIDDKANPGTFYPANTGIGNSIIGALEPGKRYAAQVTIHEIDESGQEVVFANQGQSEAIWFRYGPPCDAATEVNVVASGNRVDVSWTGVAGITAWNLYYRLAGAANWTKQAAESSPAVLSGLTPGKYEVAVLPACSTELPGNHAWPFEVTDTTPIDLLGTLVSLADSTRPVKIPCESQVSDYDVCSPVHPVVPLPTGTLPLTSLKAGDLLTMYDLSILVTEVSAGSAAGFSGKGLVRLPAMQDAGIAVSFSGIQAWQPAANPGGGCVYAGEIQSREATQEAIQAELAGVPFVPGTTTLKEVLARYDSLARQAAPGSSRQATLLATLTGQILSANAEILGKSTLPPAIADSLNRYSQWLTANLQAGSTTGAPAFVPDLLARYEALQRSLPAGATGLPSNTPPQPIREVQVVRTTPATASMQWLGDPAYTHYLITYQVAGGGEQVAWVTSPQAELPNLLSGSDYTFTIEAYAGDVAKSKYGPGSFHTPKDGVSRPENLAYVVTSPTSVNITWDKKPDQLRYKLVYTDSAGVEHTLYPDVNQAVLTGLTPDQRYNYSVVAIGKGNVVSEMATGNVVAGLACQLGLTVYTRASSSMNLFSMEPFASMTGNPAILMPTGCENGVISWSNGTIGTYTGHTLHWADGETAEKLPGLVSLRAIVVNPSKTTSYTVYCKMSQNGVEKVCSAQREVVAQSAGCGNGFVIQASPLAAGEEDIITLSASGCTGKLIWSTGIQDSTQIHLRIRKNTIVSATCQKGSQVCFSNALSLKALPSCIESIYLYHYWTVKEGSWFHKKTHSYTSFRVTGCEHGSLEWSFKGNVSSAEAATCCRYYVLKDIEGPVTVTVKCISENTDCPPFSQTFQQPRGDCEGKGIYVVDAPLVINGTLVTGAKTVYSPGNPFTLFGPDGTIFNNDPKDLVTIPGQPFRRKLTAVFSKQCSLPVWVEATVYAVNWFDSQKSNNFSLNTKATFADITSQVNALNGGNSPLEISMDLTACPGQVTWTSNTDTSFQVASRQLVFSNTPNPEKPNSFLFPVATTTYSAVCLLPDGTVITPADNARTLIVQSESCMQISQRPGALRLGEKVTLTATGCQGEVSWALAGKVLGTGPAFSPTPLPAQVPGNVRYEARCTNPVCQTPYTVYVQPCSLKVSTEASPVAIAAETRLTATGCSGGTVRWNTGDEGAQITVRPLQETTYRASCQTGDSTLCSGSVTVKVINQPPPPLAYPAFSICANPNPAAKCSNEKIVITPAGCPAGSKITWNDTLVTGPAEPFVLSSLRKAINVTATCTNSYQLSTTAQVMVGVSSELTVTPTDVYMGYPFAMYASGCYAGDCSPGQYAWRNIATGKTYSGSSIYVDAIVADSVAFEVRCSDGQVKRVSVKGKKVCEEGLSFSSNGSTKTLHLDNADLAYSITWKKVENRPGKRTESIVATDVTSLKITEPRCQSQELDSEDDYFVNYVKKDGTPCVASTFFFCTNDGGSGMPSPGDPTTPDACADISVNEVDRDSYGTDEYLLSQWCPGTKVEWFTDEARTNLLATLAIGQRYHVGRMTQSRVFYDRCYLADGTVCEGSLTIKIRTSGAREAAAACAPGVAAPAPAEIPASTALQPYLSQVLCQTVNLYQGNRAAAAAALDTLLAMLQPEAVAGSLSEREALIQEMTDGKCSAASALLAGYFPGTIPVAGYQKLVSRYPAIVKGIEEAVRPYFLNDRVFFSPDWKPFTTRNRFSVGLCLSPDQYASRKAPEGTVYGIIDVINGQKQYTATFDAQNHFTGYRDNAGNLPEDWDSFEITPADSAKAYLVEYLDSGARLVGYSTSFGQIVTVKAGFPGNRDQLKLEPIFKGSCIQAVSCELLAKIVSTNPGSITNGINGSDDACLRALSTGLRQIYLTELVKVTGTGVYSSGDNFDAGLAILKLVRTSQDEAFQQTVLLAFQDNNYALLRTVYDKEPFAKVTLPLFEELAGLVTDHYNNLGVKPTLAPIDLAGFLGKTNLSLPVADQPYFARVKGNSAYTLENLNITFGTYQAGSEEFTTGNRIRFRQNYTSYDAPPRLYATGTTPNIPGMPVEYDAALNPYEPVRLYLVDSYPALNLTKGTELTVPAFFGLALLHAIDQQEKATISATALRIGLSLAAVLTAPETGGGSLTALQAIQQIGAVAGGIDVALQGYYSSLTNEEKLAERSTLEAWDIAYSAVGMLETGALATASVGKYLYLRGQRVAFRGKAYQNTLAEQPEVAETFQNGLSVLKNEAVAAKALVLAKAANLASLKAWVQGLDEALNAGLLLSLNRMDASYLPLLDADLASASMGAEIKTLLTTAEDLSIWKTLKDDPAYAHDLGEEGIGYWEKWGKSNFFKTVTKTGREFEQNVCLKAFSDRSSPDYLKLKAQFLSDFSKNLDNYDMYSQVQLIYNSAGDYFVADQVFVKYKTINNRQVIDDVVVIENKLSKIRP